jgi:DeoR/GlpR family transcriptional regulator of sugar metabolism
MNKSKLEQRAEYIAQRVNSVRCKTSEIKRIAQELFLSEKTVYRDLKNKQGHDEK